MKYLRHWSMILLLFGIASSALAQSRVKLIVTPHEALVQPGEGVKFEAAAFDANGRPLRLENVRWTVEPDTLGKITDDGFFMAGRLPGKGRVLAFAKVLEVNELLEAEAVVVVGRPDPPRVVVVISPAIAVVPPGLSEQFQAAAFSASRDPIRIKNVRWSVRPENLGKINDAGLFSAGPELGEGVIIAFVETEFGVFNGEARVTVAELPSAAISGKVSAANDPAAPLAGIVFAEGVGRSRGRGAAKIDSLGNYFIDHLPPGLYVVRAQARGFLPEYYQEAASYLEATPVQLAEHDTVDSIDFTLEHGGAIQGTLSADDRNAPLAGAHVVAILAVRPTLRHHAVTDTEGKYVIPNLPGGTYAVFAEAEGYKGEYYDDAKSLIEAKLIQVVAPQTVDEINFSLAPGSALAGQVVGAISKEPIAHAKITIIPAPPSPLPFLKTAETNENGEYLASVPPGKYVVLAEARGYLPEFFAGVRNPREATIVEVKPDERTTGINFELDELGSISGVVVDQNTGDPIIGALVLAFPERSTVPPQPGPRGPLAGRTDSTGSYKITGVVPGKYFVLAEARGYLNEYWNESADLPGATLLEVKEGEAVPGIDFTLERGGAISGTVLSANEGKPIAGALVQVWNIDSNAAARGETDREGKYRINGLRTGQYLVAVEARGFKHQFYDGAESRDQATPVKVEAPNETAGIDFKLEPADARRGAIAGLIVSETDGNPIAEASVLAVPLQPGRPQLAFADRMGGYKFSELAPGKYLLFAFAPHFLGEFYDNAQTFQEATPLNVAAGHELGGIDFKLAPRERGGYVISGTIRRGNGDQGESNAVVYAMANEVFIASAITDGNGNFVMDGMPAGIYKIMASAPGGSAFFGGRDANSATTVNLVNGINVSSVTINVPGSTNAVTEAKALPKSFSLEQNYPNPFNPETVIPYQLAGRDEVKLIIYNALGQEVRHLVSATQEAGVYKVQWDGKDNQGRALTSGVYIYRLITSEAVFTRKMIYLR